MDSGPLPPPPWRSLDSRGRPLPPLPPPQPLLRHAVLLVNGVSDQQADVEDLSECAQLLQARVNALVDTIPEEAGRGHIQVLPVEWRRNATLEVRTCAAGLVWSAKRYQYAVCPQTATPICFCAVCCAVLLCLVEAFPAGSRGGCGEKSFSSEGDTRPVHRGLRSRVGLSGPT